VDKNALQELFDYTTFTWASYGKSVRRLAPADFMRPIEGSGWPALSNALFHIASAWDGWICEQSGVALEEIEATDLTDWAQLDAIRQTNRTMLGEIIDGASQSAVDERIISIVPGGPPEMTRGEIIAHILLHERGHHGDVSTLLSLLGAEPPNIDYMTYVFFRNRKK
jgi:uncharacterized damage-inducible protein DinB